MLKLGLGEKNIEMRRGRERKKQETVEEGKKMRKIWKAETQEDQNNVGENKTMSAFSTSSCQIDKQLPRCQIDHHVIFL